MAYSKAEKFPVEEISLANIAKALGHPARIAIVKFLCRNDRCICNDIVEELPLSQSTVSQHLKALKNAGLIVGNIEGPAICYCLNRETWGKAKSYFLSLFEKINCC